MKRAIFGLIAVVLLASLPKQQPTTTATAKAASDQPVKVVRADPTSPPIPGPVTPPELTLPETKTVKANRYFCLRPGTNCKSIKWIVPDGLDQLDPEIALKDAFAIVLIGDSGVYRVSCYGALGDQVSDISTCTVTIGTPPPPIPPIPPTPPAPVDPFTQALQTAYNQDADSDKAKSLAFLQEVYAGMASSAGSWTGVSTTAQLLAKMKSIVESPGVGLTATQVVNLRKAIAVELDTAFTTAANAPVNLTTVASELSKVANALKGVK